MTRDMARELNGSWTGWSCDTQKWKIFICLCVPFCHMLPRRVNKAVSELYTTFLVHLHTKNMRILKLFGHRQLYLVYQQSVCIFPGDFIMTYQLKLIKWRTDFSSPEPSTDPPAGPGENPPAALKNSSWRRTGDWRSFQPKTQRN